MRHVRALLICGKATVKFYRKPSETSSISFMTAKYMKDFPPCVPFHVPRSLELVQLCSCSRSAGGKSPSEGQETQKPEICPGPDSRPSLPPQMSFEGLATVSAP